MIICENINCLHGISLTEGYLMISEGSEIFDLPDEELIQVLKKAREHIKFVNQLIFCDYFIYGYTYGYEKEIENEEFDKLVGFDTNIYISSKEKESIKNIIEKDRLLRERKELISKKTKIRRTVNKTLRQEVILRDNSKCQYCGSNLSKDEIYLDHIIPYSLGGLTEKSNLVVSCMKCNLKKSNNLLENINMKLIESEVNNG